MKKNDVRCENCLDTMALMPDNFVDLVVTSPPYDSIREYEGHTLSDFEKIASELFRIVKRGGVVVWVVGDQTINGNETGTSFRQALYFKEIGFNLFDTMIYLKMPRGGIGSNKTYWEQFEYMFVFSKGLPKTINLLRDRKNKESRPPDKGSKRNKKGNLYPANRSGYGEYGRRTNVWEYKTGKSHSAIDNLAYQHPAIFPESLAQDHILSWSNKEDIVYDPFLGSGTVALMAKLNGRHYIASEINPTYCEIAKERIRLNTLAF